MRDDHTGSVKHDCPPDDFAWIDRSLIDGAVTLNFICKKIATVVKEQNPEVFNALVSHGHTQIVKQCFTTVLQANLWQLIFREAEDDRPQCIEQHDGRGVDSRDFA